MAKMKIAITIEEALIREIDVMIKNRLFANRSNAIESAVSEKVDRMQKTRLARECAKLDKKYERSMAEEGMESEEWPEY